MTEKSRTKIICCVITGVCSVLSAGAGIGVGQVLKAENILGTFNQQAVTINGDNNTVTFHDMDEVFQSYFKMYEENSLLQEKNDSYFEDVTNLKAEVKEQNAMLEENDAALDAMPSLHFSDIGLIIDGEDVNVRKQRSMVTIDDADYFSEDFVKGFLGENQQMTLKEDTLYIGRIIAEKASLLDQYVSDSKHISIVESARDAAGNFHTEALDIYTGMAEAKIIFSLQEQYSMLRFQLTAAEDSQLEKTGNIVIYADGEPVYTSPDLSKTMEVIADEVPINNCLLLTIAYSGDGGMDCIMWDVEVYN